MTDDEKERLEQLRQELRLTSKGQVLRVALDLLEAVQVGQDSLIGSDKQETRRIMRRIRRHLGVPRRQDLEAAPADDAVAINKNIRTKYTHVVGGGEPGANVGLPDIAPTPPDHVDEKQLELPEMPPQSVPDSADSEVSQKQSVPPWEIKKLDTRGVHSDG